MVPPYPLLKISKIRKTARILINTLIIPVKKGRGSRGTVGSLGKIDFLLSTK